MVGTYPIKEMSDELGEAESVEMLNRIAEDVKGAAYRIIEAKRATYYGIGMAMTRITKAIFGDESSILTVSAMLRGEYGENGVFVGVPCIINKNGIQKVLELNLSPGELEMLGASCDILRSNMEGLE